MRGIFKEGGGGGKFIRLRYVHLAANKWKKTSKNSISEGLRKGIKNPDLIG